MMPLERATTILDCLEHYAAVQPEASAYTFIGHKDEDRQVLSYGDLRRRATAYAAVLEQAGLAGQNVLLLFPNGLDFIIGFFACAYAGVGLPSLPISRVTATITPASGKSWRTPVLGRC